MLAECFNEAQLSPPHLMQVNFCEPHLGVFGEPGSVLSKVSRNKDGLPNVFSAHEMGDRVEISGPTKIPVHFATCRVWDPLMEGIALRLVLAGSP